MSGNQEGFIPAELVENNCLVTEERNTQSPLLRRSTAPQMKKTYMKERPRKYSDPMNLPISTRLSDPFSTRYIPYLETRDAENVNVIQEYSQRPAPPIPPKRIEDYSPFYVITPVFCDHCK